MTKVNVANESPRSLTLSSASKYLIKIGSVSFGGHSRIFFHREIDIFPNNFDFFLDFSTGNPIPSLMDGVKTSLGL